MKLFFLDAGGILLVPVAIIGFIVIAVLLEAVIMLLFKLNKFGKCVLDSFIVNVVSLIAGFILRSAFGNIGTERNIVTTVVTTWVIIFAITVVIEGLLLMLLNKKKPRQKIWLVTVVMNLASYFILYLMFTFG